MTVLLPIVRDDDSTACWRPTKPVEGLLANYKSSCTEQMTTLINRAPKWNDQLAAYVLNFNGRVTMPSVKNFQLVHEGLDEVVLQFGKTGKDHFTMDFTWPMSPVQAFSVCISALDNKLMCE
jgi:tubby-related protein 1